MKLYSEELTFHTKKLREIINITPQVKAAMEKSGFTDGLILVSTLHSNSAVISNDEEPGLLEDLEDWLNQIAPVRDDYKHRGRFESNAAVHLQALLLHHQVVVPFTQQRLDLGPWQSIQYVELDGQRPKRVAIRVLGE